MAKKKKKVKRGERCERCGQYYPVEFISPLYAMGKYTRVDPVCALAIMTDVHGVEFTKFNGEMAENMRLDFLAWKEECNV